MPACQPTHDVSELPIPGNCVATCANVSFSLDSMASSTDDSGDCEFTWTVTRTTRDDQGNIIATTPFSGTATVACPGVELVDFHCDAAKQCPRFRLRLTCGTEGAGDGDGA